MPAKQHDNRHRIVFIVYLLSLDILDMGGALIISTPSRENCSHSSRGAWRLPPGERIYDAARGKDFETKFHVRFQPLGIYFVMCFERGGGRQLNCDLG